MHMETKLPYRDSFHPWIIGSYAVYAQDIHVARQVYEYARAQPAAVPFGTIELETGEMIDWINMRYGVLDRGKDG